jgi:outer membrane protein assembly factor BamB
MHIHKVTNRCFTVLAVAATSALALGAGAQAASAAVSRTAHQLPGMHRAQERAGRTAMAQPKIKLSATTGPPTGTVKVSGTGFGAYETVDIYFDTTDEALASTNGSGKFSGSAISVPAPAQPGTHYVTADGRHTGRSAQATYTINTNWSQPGYSAAHQGTNPYENVLSPGTVSGIDQKWSFTTGNSVTTSQAVVNGVVYATSEDGSLYALNAATGTKIWSFNSANNSNNTSSPAVANGVVYAGFDDGSVYALNAATGTKIWSFSSGTSDIASSPAVANGVVYITSAFSLYALSAATGAELWSVSGQFGDASPTVAHGVVYLTTVDGVVDAFDAATGATVWTYTAPAFLSLSAPAVADGEVFVGGDDGNVYAIQADSGTEAWNFTTGDQITFSPAVANGVVYAGSGDGNLYALDAVTGAKLWSYATGSRINSTPTVADGVVYASTLAGVVYAIDAATGAKLAGFNVSSSTYGSSPVVANGVIYIGSNDNHVYAYGLSGGIAPVHRPATSDLHPDHALRPRPSR